MPSTRKVVSSSRSIIFYLRKEFNESLRTCTTHGLAKLIQRDKLLCKLVWLSLILASASLAVSLIVKNIFDYLEFNVNTEVRHIDLTLIEFPTVTICNKNQYSTEYSFQFLKDILEKNLVNESIRNKRNASFGKSKRMFNAELYKRYKELRNAPIYQTFHLLIDDRQRLTNTMKEMLVKCDFESDRHCDHEEFEWVYNEVFGNCYRFNSNNSIIQKIRRTKEYYGLSIDLNLDVWWSDESDIPLFDEGILISIDPHDVNPFNDFNNVVEAACGLETNILLQRSDFDKYPKPYSNCDFQTTNEIEANNFFREITDAGYVYSRDLCVEFCLNRALANVCSCGYLFSSIKMNDMKICTHIDDILCVWKHKFVINDSYLQESCLKECPLQCKKTVYESLITQNPFPAIDLELPEYQRFNGSSDTIVRVNIFYNSLSHMKYKETPSMPWISLISNIGGTLGLFLGMSVLSCVELVESLINCLLIFVRKKEFEEH